MQSWNVTVLKKQTPLETTQDPYKIISNCIYKKQSLSHIPIKEM